MLAVRNCCYVAVCSAVRGASASTGEERAGHIMAAARLYLVVIIIMLKVMFAHSYRENNQEHANVKNTLMYSSVLNWRRNDTAESLSLQSP